MSSSKDIQTPFGVFRNNQDGTFTDLQRKLMWMSAPVGMTWDGSSWCGQPEEMTWWVATQKFGRGVASYAWNQQKLGDIVQASAPLSRRQNGFASGKEKYEFAGYSDWNLPTLDELATFTFNSKYTTFEYQSQVEVDDNYFHQKSTRLMLAELFHPIQSPDNFLYPFWTTWAANPCGWRPRSLIRLIDPHWWSLRHSTAKTQCHHAWSLTICSEIPVDAGGYPDQPGKCCATLVRQAYD